jgi:hypothetical protein
VLDRAEEAVGDLRRQRNRPGNAEHTVGVDRHEQEIGTVVRIVRQLARRRASAQAETQRCTQQTDGEVA